MLMKSESKLHSFHNEFFFNLKLPLFSLVFSHTHFKVSDAIEYIAVGSPSPGGSGCVE